MPEVTGCLSGLGFRIKARECVLEALPGLEWDSSLPSADIEVEFIAIPQRFLSENLLEDISELLAKFHCAPFVGGGLQTFPLMLNNEQRLSVADLLNAGTNSTSVPFFSVPTVMKRIMECVDHASEVLFISHALTVELRDFREHRIDIFYLEELESLLYSEFALEGFRRMFSIFLPDFDSLMIHSSSLLRNDKVMMFLAADEGGKSTAVSLAGDGIVLSDDRNIFRKNSSGIEVRGTPWGKINNMKKHAPVGGLFLLEKAEVFCIEPLDPKILVYFMWEDNRPFWDHLPRSRRTKVLDLLVEISRSAPVYRMKFPKDHIDWAALDAVTSF